MSLAKKEAKDKSGKDQHEESKSAKMHEEKAIKGGTQYVGGLKNLECGGLFSDAAFIPGGAGPFGYGKRVF